MLLQFKAALDRITALEKQLAELKLKAGDKGDKGDKGDSVKGDKGDSGDDGKTPTRGELLVLIKEVFAVEKPGLKGNDGKPADETKVAALIADLEKLKNHEFRILIRDKDGNVSKRRDGSDNEIRFSFEKDGSLTLLPVPVVSP